MLKLERQFLDEEVVAYLDHQAQDYSATLLIQGHYLEITSDTRLANGSRVISINSEGVLFQQGNEYY
ncbi:hypothetical protein [Candidatus Coxiella mudrowiae]|uniref:hypothetical protein n=1 Tax=Candidatus Coxiella mudrowiae TaxID=2054173 RepID=UPI00066278AA|nr:hypothetical protein [Candidatus Coxiella mudrowiae]